MKLKKIIFAIICAALLVGSTIACFASASTGTDVSIQSTKSYTYTATYNGVTLKAMGQPGAPASISQAVISSSSTTSKYYAETFVERKWNNTVYEESTNNAVVAFSDAVTSSVKQDASNKRTYNHDVILHAGTTYSTPIVKTLSESVTF